MRLDTRHDALECPAEPLSERVHRIVHLRTASRVKDLRVDVQGRDVIALVLIPCQRPEPRCLLLAHGISHLSRKKS